MLDSILMIPLTGIYWLTAQALTIPIAVLAWVADNSISFTHQPVVELGWQICRDLVNVGLVLALIFVALAMILRINEYGNGKLLYKLIIFAILVNFTPVICGLIIDLASIIMNIFKLPAITSLTEIVTNFSSVAGFFAVRSVGILIAGIVFNIIAFFVFFIYALIFLIRIPILWMLVIISPFALFGLFYPVAKKVWSEWWQQFQQWTIIGIPLFFFLYLAGLIYKNPVCKIVKPAGTTMAAWMNEQVLCGLLSFLFPIFFLIIGLGFAFTFKLPKEVGDLAKKGEAKSKQWLNRARTSAGSAIRSTPVITKAEGAIRRRMESVPVLRNVFGGVGAYDRSLNTRRSAIAGKRLEGLSDNQKRSIMKDPLANPFLRTNAAKSIEKLTDDDRSHIKSLSTYDKDLMKNAQKQMPHWIEKNKIQESVLDQEAKDFADKINVLAFGKESIPGGPRAYTNENLEVLYGMDINKALALGKKSIKTRKALKQMITEKDPEITAYLNSLHNIGTQEAINKADRIKKVIDYVNINANYRF